MTLSGTILSFINFWATTFDVQQWCILTSLDSDEPVQPPFKHRNSKWCLVSSLTAKEYLSDKQRLWSVCAWSEPLLVAHTMLLEISRHGSNFHFQLKKSLIFELCQECCSVIFKQQRDIKISLHVVRGAWPVTWVFTVITQPSIYGIVVYFLLCHESLNYWPVNKFDYWLALLHGLVTCFPVKNTKALIDMRDNDVRMVRLWKETLCNNG